MEEAPVILGHAIDLLNQPCSRTVESLLRRIPKSLSICALICLRLIGGVGACATNDLILNLSTVMQLEK